MKPGLSCLERKEALGVHMIIIAGSYFAFEGANPS
jgi:hypothetical protein